MFGTWCQPRINILCLLIRGIPQRVIIWYLNGTPQLNSLRVYNPGLTLYHIISYYILPTWWRLGIYLENISYPDLLASSLEDFETKTPGWPFLWRLCLAPSSFQIIFEGICEGISMNIINGGNMLGKIINGCSGNITGMCLRGNSWGYPIPVNTMMWMYLNVFLLST